MNVLRVYVHIIHAHIVMYKYAVHKRDMYIRVHQLPLYMSELHIGAIMIVVLYKLRNKSVKKYYEILSSSTGSTRRSKFGHKAHV